MTLVTGDAEVGGHLPQGAADFLTILRYSDNGVAATAVDTMRVGFTSPQAHIEAVRNFREVLRSASFQRARDASPVQERSPMQAVSIAAPGGPKQLIFGDRPALKVC